MSVKPCIRCGRLAPATYCSACSSARWAEQSRRRASRPWYAGTWHKQRAAHLRAHPTCQNCGATTGLEVDHIHPRSLAGGLMTLCRACHHAKTIRDHALARRRSA